MKRVVGLALILGLLFGGSAKAAVGEIKVFSDGYKGGGNSPGAMVSGPDGNIWFAGNGVDGGSIGRITPSGNYTYFSQGMTPGANPSSITRGPDGNLWFIESGTYRIGKITPAGTITEFDIGVAQSGAFPTGITAGGGGWIWVSVRDNIGGNYVVRVETSGSYVEFPAPPGFTPTYLTDGPDGNIWAIDAFAPRLIRISPGGNYSEFTDGITNAAKAVTTGPGGNLWFTESGNPGFVGRMTSGGTVTEFSEGLTANPGLTGIAYGDDGNLWFTEANVSKIGRITNSGDVTEFSLELGSQPISIASGPDRNIWFSTSSGIGRIETGAAPAGAVSKPAQILKKKIKVRKRKVAVAIRNPNPVKATGKLDLTWKPGRKVLNLTGKNFKVAAGRSQVVTMTLPPKAWKKLKKSGKLKVGVRIALSGGGMTKRSSASLTLVTG